MSQKTLVTVADSWASLARYTPARIALGRAGVSLQTRDVLAFSQAHAQARDAVHAELDVPAVQAALASLHLQTVSVCSAAPHRQAYLARPDWGRRLHPDTQLVAPKDAPDLVFVLSDGLSATAVERNAPALLEALVPRLEGLHMGPIVIARQARVALADEVGSRLCARLVVSLIGERPGLSSPDSLGAYLTYAPKPGRTDAERNCISNIRPGGLSYEQAAVQVAALIRAALAARCSGVALPQPPIDALGG